MAEEVLTQEEKDTALRVWNEGEVSLKKIIEAACGGGHDGRSKKGIAIKEYLGNLGNKPLPIQETYVKKTDKIEITEENKTFIKDNFGSIKPLEMTKIIFGAKGEDKEYSPLSAEFRVIKNYIDSVDPTKDTKIYNPPKTLEQSIARINKYVGKEFKATELTIREKECAECLIRYMNILRFVTEINNLTKVEDKALFESQFIRYCWNKSDLVEEDVDLYINVCKDFIRLKNLENEHAILSEMKDAQMEEGKFPLPLLERITEMDKAIDSTFKRHKDALNSLNKKRSDRLDEMNQSFGSILNLVEAFRGSQTRNKWLELAERRKLVVNKEKDRLEGLDELLTQVFGIHKDEI